MNTKGYKVGDLINNKHGLELKIQEIDNDPDESDVTYITTCTKCDYIFEMVADSLEHQKICPLCIGKSTVVEFDANGTPASFNGISLGKYFMYLGTAHGLSDPEAFDLMKKLVELSSQLMRSSYHENS